MSGTCCLLRAERVVRDTASCLAQGKVHRKGLCVWDELWLAPAR